MALLPDRVEPVMIVVPDWEKTPPPRADPPVVSFGIGPPVAVLFWITLLLMVSEPVVATKMPPPSASLSPPAVARLFWTTTLLSVTLHAKPRMPPPNTLRVPANAPASPSSWAMPPSMMRFWKVAVAPLIPKTRSAAVCWMMLVGRPLASVAPWMTSACAVLVMFRSPCRPETSYRSCVLGTVSV
jgi:hypothetical protein